MNKIKLKDYPIGFIGTCLGAVTLTSLYPNFEFNAVRSIFIYIGLIALIFWFLRFLKHPDVMWKEMNNPILMALYPTATMLLMNIAVYFLKFNHTFALTLWYIGFIINIFFVIFFLITHVVKKFDIKSVLPCWYVLLVGISVSCTTSPAMHTQNIVKPVFYFVVISFLTYLPVVIYRLCTVEVPDAQYPLICIFAAPASLCVISYITLFNNPSIYIVSLFFILCLITTIYVYINFPRIFKLNFNPTFAAITFPLAVSTVASVKVSGYLIKTDFKNLGAIVNEIAGIELFIATGVICFVFYKFVFHFLMDIPAKKFTK
ncbi:TDT family transporter [Clostridium sp. CTA-5]